MRTTACLLSLLLTLPALAAENLPTPRPDWKLEVLLSSPELKHPSVVCSAPDGKIFVAEDPMDIATPRADMTEGRILCLHPDGRLTVFADKLYAVFGLQYLDGKLYVLHNPKFSVFTDDNGIGKDRLDLIESTNPNPWALDWNDHVPANFRLAMDGYFYVAVGDKGLYNCVGRDGKRIDLKGGGILRLRPDGTQLEVFSTGVRNILDVALTDEDDLFTYDNTDEQQWMSRLTHMVDGGFYGYPYDFIPRRPYTLWMLADYGPGAATGALAYTEDALPPDYHNNLFLADFGKRNILRIKLQRDGATFKATEKTDLLTNVPDDFRPVGIALSHDGTSIYICDWQHRDTKENVTVGRLLKLTYTGKSHATPKPQWYAAAASGRAEIPEAELLDALGHPSRNVRLAAQRLLAPRTKNQPLAHLIDLLESRLTPTQAKLHLVWLLQSHPHDRAHATLAQAATAQSLPLPVRRQAIRALGTLKHTRSPDAIHKSLANPDASIRFQAATALGRINHPDSLFPLRLALNDSDAWVRYAAFTALNRMGRSDPKRWAAIVQGLEAEQRAIREGTTFALRETYDPELVNQLVALFRDKAKADSARFLAVSLLANIHRKPPEWKGEWWAYHPVNSPPPQKTVPWESTDVITATIRAALNDSSKNVVIHAIDAVRITRDTASAPKLRQIMKDPADLQTSHLLIRTLGELRDQASIDTFIKTLAMNPDDLDPFTISLVLEAAEKIAHPKFIPALARHANLPHETHAKLALSALTAIDKTNEDATAAMLPALSHPNPNVRKHAARLLGDRRARSALPHLLAAVNDPRVRADAITALTKLPDPHALDAYLFALSGKDATLRDQARSAIRATAPHALPMIEARLHTLSPNTVAELQRALEDFPPAKDSPLFSKQVARPEPRDYETFALKNQGDPARGKTLFNDLEGLACARCHPNAHARPAPDRNQAQALMPGRATPTTAIGPDLTTIGTQFPRAQLIESILHPNKSVREGFAEFIITTKFRDQFTGLFRGEDAESITLLDATGALQRIPKDRINQRRTSDRSIMPEELHAPLSLQEFTDLIAFLESCKTNPEDATNTPGAGANPPEGFTPLFNGNDLSGWKADDETKKHWTVKTGILHHDGIAKDLWTDQDFTDFELQLDFRFPGAPTWQDHPLIASDGSEVTDASGKVVTKRVLDAGDSGVFLRHRKAQANLFFYPIGSGEVWEYRTDPTMPPEVRRAVTPKTQADNPPGQWNRMLIRLKGNHLTVTLNNTKVITNAPLPGIPDKGPIGLQHEHGPVDFRNIFLRPLDKK